MMEMTMKKTLVSVGVIVAIGAIWTGSSWYIGKQVEADIADFVAGLNTELTAQAPQLGLEISYGNYHRGIFTSDLQLTVKNSANSQTPRLPEGQNLVLNEKIYHGPFPGIASFNLMPGLAAVASTLEKNALTEKLFSIAKDRSLLEVMTHVSFDASTASTLNILPIESVEGDEQVQFSGSKIKMDVDSQGDRITFSGNADSGRISTLNNLQQRVEVNFNNLTFDGDTKNSLPELRTGIQNIVLKKLAVTVDNKEIAKLDDVSLHGQSGVSPKDNTLNLQADYAIGGLSVDQQNLGGGKASLKIDRVDAPALSKVIATYNKTAAALLTDPTLAEDQDMYQQALARVMVQQFPALLQSKPHLTLGPVAWKNSKGESTFNLSLDFKDPNQQTTDPMTPEQIIGRYINTLDTRLVIPMPMATELMTQVAQIEGHSAEESQQLADQQVKGFAALGQMFHVTQVENDNITASFTFKDEQAALNGNPISLSDLIGMFGAIQP